MKLTSKSSNGYWDRLRRAHRRSVLTLASLFLSFVSTAVAQQSVPEHVISVVLNTSVSALPDGLRTFLESQRECLLSLSIGKECRVGDETLVNRYESHSHYIMLDAAAKEHSGKARLEAAQVFPMEAKQAKKLFTLVGIKGGDLPWALLAAQRELVGAMKKVDAPKVLLATASIFRLSAAAALPFNTTTDRDGSKGGIVLSDLPKEVPTDLSTPRGRCQGLTLNSLAPRLLYEVRIWPARVTTINDPGTEIRRVILESHLALHKLLWVDQEALRQFRLSEASSASFRWRDYEAAMLDRTGSLWEQQLESSALLAGRLLLTAWEEGGAPELADDSKAGKDEKPPLGESTGADDYVASRQSTIFHSPNCPHVKRIHPKNLTRFGDFKAAAATGRAPCRTCKPVGR